MAAPKGNKFWQNRSKHGRDKLFSTPDILWEAACEYFQWCDDNPLKEEKAFAYQGVISKESVNLMRAYTLKGLCLYLRCNDDYFRQFKKNLGADEQGFSWVISQIEDTIYSQKFEGAAAGLLNANIIARDLGLKEKIETESKVEVKQTKEELLKELEDIKKRRGQSD